MQKSKNAIELCDIFMTFMDSNLKFILLFLKVSFKISIPQIFYILNMESMGSVVFLLLVCLICYLQIFKGKIKLFFKLVR